MGRSAGCHGLCARTTPGKRHHPRAPRQRQSRDGLARHVFRYEAHGWELGRNLPSKMDILDQLDARLDTVMGGRKIPISLVGWSLGGLIAREYAKRAPERIAAVITMGSPFSGNPRHNRAWRAYEMAARHKLEASPFAAGLATKPPVPTTAIWSRRDGVIPPRAARGLPHERDTAIEVHCGHLGYICAPDALEAVLRALAD
jgi:pimeloyl-ACP methyl ester carboxylesterase